FLLGYGFCTLNEVAIIFCHGHFSSRAEVVILENRNIGVSSWTVPKAVQRRAAPFDWRARTNHLPPERSNGRHSRDKEYVLFRRIHGRRMIWINMLANRTDSRDVYHAAVDAGSSLKRRRVPGASFERLL